MREPKKPDEKLVSKVTFCLVPYIKKTNSVVQISDTLIGTHLGFIKAFNHNFLVFECCL